MTPVCGGFSADIRSKFPRWQELHQADQACRKARDHVQGLNYWLSRAEDDENRERLRLEILGAEAALAKGKEAITEIETDQRRLLAAKICTRRTDQAARCRIRRRSIRANDRGRTRDRQLLHLRSPHLSSVEPRGQGRALRRHAVKVLWRPKPSGGTARPHLLRISGARKSVVAVTGEAVRQCLGDEVPHRSEMTR